MQLISLLSGLLGVKVESRKSSAGISRRDAIKLLLSSSAAMTVDVEKLLWSPRTMVTVDLATYPPSVINLGGRVYPVSLYGVPYHVVHDTTGTWLGIRRSNMVMFNGKIPTEGYPLSLERLGQAFTPRIIEVPESERDYLVRRTIQEGLRNGRKDIRRRPPAGKSR